MAFDLEECAGLVREYRRLERLESEIQGEKLWNLRRLAIATGTLPGWDDDQTMTEEEKYSAALGMLEEIERLYPDQCRASTINYTIAAKLEIATYLSEMIDAEQRKVLPLQSRTNTVGMEK